MKNIRFFLVAVFFLSFVASVFSQDETENEYAYGTVVSLTDTDILLKEYNYEKEEFVEISYKISPDLKVRNAESIRSITPGNQVEILFSEKDTTKSALVIVLEKDEGVVESGEESAAEPSDATPAPSSQVEAPLAEATAPAAATTETTAAPVEAPAQKTEAPAAPIAPAQEALAKATAETTN